MCISSSLRPGCWSGCSVRTLLTLKLRCTPGDKEHYEKVWGRGLGQQRILNGSRKEGPLSTVQLVNGVTYPKLSNAVLGTAVKGYSEKKVGMNRGHFVPQAVIRRFCCNLVAFSLSPPQLLEDFFSDRILQRTAHCETRRGRAALVKGAEGCDCWGLDRIMVSNNSSLTPLAKSHLLIPNTLYRGLFWIRWVWILKRSE